MNNAHHLGIESSWECVGHLSWKDQEYVEEQREACAGLSKAQWSNGIR